MTIYVLYVINEFKINFKHQNCYNSWSCSNIFQQVVDQPIIQDQPVAVHLIRGDQPAVLVKQDEENVNQVVYQLKTHSLYYF